MKSEYNIKIFKIPIYFYIISLLIFLKFNIYCKLDIDQYEKKRRESQKKAINLNDIYSL